MAVQREEEKLGAFTLLRHFRRIMGYARDRRWLLALCVVVSMAQAGLELSLPLLTRRGIDAYILPPLVKVKVEGVLRDRLLAAPGTTPLDDGSLLVRWADLPRDAREELSARRLADGARYYAVEPGVQAPGLVRAGDAAVLPEAGLKALSAAERARLLEPSRRGLLHLAFLYLGLLIANFLLSYAVTYGLNDLGQRAVMVLRGQVFERLHRLPVRFFDENPVGRLVTRVTNDTATLSDLFTSVVATAVSDVALFVGIVAVLFSLDAGLSVRLLVLAPPLVLLSLWFKASSQKIYRDIRVQLARLNTFLQESVQGIAVIKAFVVEARASARFHALGETFYKTQMRLIYIFAIFRPLIDAFATSAVALVVWYAGGQILLGASSVGTLAAFLLYLKMLFMPLQDLAEKFNIVQSSVVASERIFKILDTPAEAPGAGEAPPESCGRIAFEHVTFAYEEGHPVLNDVSFEVPCGKTVALVGPTGSGKTTITSLLLRFYDLVPGGGRILVDGLPVEDWDVRALRRRFAFVQQDLFLFAGSLRDNITLREPMDEGRLRRAVEASRTDMVLAKLPDGLEHKLNERGTVLSQGERQLVSFARALASEPKILVLDEATASVDSRTESLIQQALKELLRGRTALVVAHRLSTVQDADEILVLHKGRIAERGNHEALMSAGGLYAHLYRTQLQRNGQAAGVS